MTKKITFRQKTLSPDESKSKKALNTISFRRKLKKAIESNDHSFNCNVKLGANDKKILQKIFDRYRFERPDKDAEVASLCIDASCEKQVIAKVLPIFKRNGSKRSNPAFVETDMMKLLTEKIILKNKTPNITMYFTSFECSAGSEVFQSNKFISYLLNKKQIDNKLIVLIAEFIHGADLNKFMNNRINDNPKSTEVMRNILFQIIFTLAVLQKSLHFVHFDLHGGNVLVDKVDPGGYWSYTIKLPKHKTKTTFYVPNIGIQVKLWDFDFATTFKKPRIRNSKVFSNKFDRAGIRDEFNPYYDINFVLQAILFHPRSKMPKTVESFIHRVIPKDLLVRQSKGKVLDHRIVHKDKRIKTPIQALDDPFFKPFLKKTKGRILLPKYSA